MPPHPPQVLESSSHPPRDARHAKLRGLYVLSHHAWGGGHEQITLAALRGGARVIQLRDKASSRAEIEAVGHRLRRLTHDFDALLLVNDDAVLARDINADGVHLGPDDISPAQARALLGPNAIVGVSCGTVEEALAAWKSGASTIGVGAIFATSTKADAGAPIGLESLLEITRATPLPVAAIGGVDASNIALLPARGARMACVISAVALAGDEAAMEQAARTLNDAFARALEQIPST